MKQIISIGNIKFNFNCTYFKLKISPIQVSGRGDFGGKKITASWQNTSTNMIQIRCLVVDFALELKLDTSQNQNIVLKTKLYFIVC